MDSVLLVTFAKDPSLMSPRRRFALWHLLVQSCWSFGGCSFYSPLKKKKVQQQKVRVGTRLPPLTKENCNLKKRRAKEELINKCQSTLSFTYQLLASMSSRFYLHTMEMIYFLLKRSGLADIWGGEESESERGKKVWKCLELFTVEMANQYWGSRALGQLFNAVFLSSQAGWRRSIKSLSVCK